VAAEDVVPRHSTEEGSLSITFAVPAVHAGQIVLELGRAGWHAESVGPVSGARKAEALARTRAPTGRGVPAPISGGYSGMPCPVRIE